MIKRVFFIVVVVSFIFCAIPRTINYQGKLTNTSGIAIDTSANVEFRLFSNVTGGSSLWSETHTALEIRKGLFDVILGSVNPIPDSLDFSRQYFIELAVNSETMAPRQPLTSTPYALHALIADYGGGGGSTIPGLGLYAVGSTFNIGNGWGIGISNDSIWVDTTRLDVRYIRTITAGNGLYSSGSTIHVGPGWGINVAADYIYADSILLDTRYRSHWLRDNDTAYIYPRENRSVKVFDDSSNIGLGMRILADTAAFLGKSSAYDAGYLGSYLIYPVAIGGFISGIKYRFPVYGISIDNGAAVAGYSGYGFGGLFTYDLNTDNNLCRAGAYGFDMTGHECGLVGATDFFDYASPYDTAVNAGVYGLAGDDPGVYIVSGTGWNAEAYRDINPGSDVFLVNAITYGYDDKAGIVGKNFYTGDIGYHGVGINGWCHQLNGKGIGVYGQGGYCGVMGMGYNYGGVFSSNIVSGKFVGGHIGIEALSPSLALFAGSSDTGSIGSAYFRGNEYSVKGLRVSLIDNPSAEKRSPVFSIDAVSPKIMSSGENRLIAGFAEIDFDNAFKNVIAENSPIIVTVTPYDICGQLIVERKGTIGFVVRENGGTSDASFGWIAIGTRFDCENPELPKEVLEKEFEINLLSTEKEQPQSGGNIRPSNRQNNPQLPQGMKSLKKE